MNAYCDRCSARAKEVWELNSIRMLFCGHHANEHRGGLRQKGWTCVEVEQ